jgi:hypothetical protein
MNPYLSSHLSTDIILTEQEQIVPKPGEDIAQKKRVFQE